MSHTNVNAITSAKKERWAVYALIVGFVLFREVNSNWDGIKTAFKQGYEAGYAAGSK